MAKSKKEKLEVVEQQEEQSTFSLVVNVANNCVFIKYPFYL